MNNVRWLIPILLLTAAGTEGFLVSDSPSIAAGSPAPGGPAPAPLSSPAVPGDDRYDPAVHMVRVEWHGPGYHTRIPDGTMAHPTRESMQYALALLSTSDPARHERAAAIIRRVLPLQDTNPGSPNYGTWPWLLEEPLEKMETVDQNWAAFIGATLDEALIDDPGKLPGDLRQAMQGSLSHACRAILRRNVTLGYTNIAVMSAAVTCAGGEALGNATFLDWGRDKLHQFLEYTRENGGFTEYNSPTYTVVAVHELERILHLVKDPQARQDAETLRRLAWQTIADHYHPGTGQWAGPHSRTYHDLLERGVAHYLADATGAAIGNIQPRPQDLQSDGNWYLPCPADLVPRFRTLPTDPLVVDSTFYRGKDEKTTLRGATWLTASACLGSINHDSLWTQRRPLIAYWRVKDQSSEPVAVLRLRFLKDGRDFASAAVISAQSGPHAASAVRLVSGAGDFHISLDRPPHGLFTAGDLRVRYELTAAGATARVLAPGVFELAAGGWRAVLHTAPESKDEEGRPMQWEVGKNDSPSAPQNTQAWLDGIYRHGDRKPLDLAQPRLPFAGIGLELLRTDQSTATAAPSLGTDGRIRWEAGGGLVSDEP